MVLEDKLDWIKVKNHKIQKILSKLKKKCNQFEEKQIV